MTNIKSKYTFTKMQPPQIPPRGPHKVSHRCPRNPALPNRVFFQRICTNILPPPPLHLLFVFFYYYFDYLQVSYLFLPHHILQFLNLMMHHLEQDIDNVHF